MKKKLALFTLFSLMLSSCSFFIFEAGPEFNHVETPNVTVTLSELDTARNFYKQRNYHRAVMAYRKASEIPQYMEPASHELGRVYYDMENMAEAVEWFKKATEHQPDNIIYLSDLAKAYHAAGDKELAVVTYQKVLQKQSSDGMTHYYLGNIYASDNVSQAIFEYKLACELKVKEACEALQGF